MVSAVDYKYGPNRLYSYDFPEIGERIEQFFSGFTSESALPNLIEAMDSSLVLGRGEIRIHSKEVIEKDKVGNIDMSYTIREDECYSAGSVWVFAHPCTYYDEVRVEFTFDELYFPIADGAIKSIENICSDKRELTSQLESAQVKYQEKYVLRPQRTFTKTVEENPRSGTVVTSRISESAR